MLAVLSEHLYATFRCYVVQRRRGNPHLRFETVSFSHPTITTPTHGHLYEPLYETPMIRAFPDIQLSDSARVARSKRRAFLQTCRTVGWNGWIWQGAVARIPHGNAGISSRVVAQSLWIGDSYQLTYWHGAELLVRARFRFQTKTYYWLLPGRNHVTQ